MNRTMVITGLVLVPAIVLSCGKDDTTAVDDSATVGEAADSMDMVQNEGALLSVATEGPATQTSAVIMPPPATAGEAASMAAERMKARLSPEGCATVTVSGATLTATLSECTGRLGLRHVTGTLTVAFSVGDDGIHASATATGLKVNRATMDISSSLVRMRSADGTLLITAVSTRGTGTGPRGKAISRDGDYSVAYDPDTECRTLTGEWKTTVGGNEYMTQVMKLKRCLYDCPEAGGRIVHTNSAKDRTISINFDGSTEAEWSTSDGKSGTEKLYCGDAGQ